MDITNIPLGAWSEQEQDALNHAIEKCGSIKAIIQEMQKHTTRSEKSIVRRLKKIGYSPRLVGKYIAACNLGI